MSGDGAWNEKRRDPRITRGFIVRFMPQGADKSKQWHVSTIQNISKSGCGFFSDTECRIGDMLDILIQLPGMPNPMSFVGEIKHCEERLNKAYYLGIKFVLMDEKAKSNLVKTVEFFLNK